jgi:hypothetical protein
MGLLDWMWAPCAERCGAIASAAYSKSPTDIHEQ